MNQMLIPSGEIQFHGTQAQFLEAVQKAGGVMEPEGKFRCTLPPPKHQGIRLSLIHMRQCGLILFRFLCEYESASDGFRIRYRVVPTFFAVVFLLMPFALAIAACRQFAGTKVGFYPLWIAGMAIPAIVLCFLWERAKQTEQFQEIFREGP